MLTEAVGNMELVWQHMEGVVAIVRLASGVTNPLGSPMVGELLSVVERVRDDPEAKALLLTSESERFFSIGLDIPELIGYDKEGFRQFARMFDRLCIELYRMPKPTVVAIRGHATAGGAILALCGDHRVMTSGRGLHGGLKRHLYPGGHDDWCLTYKEPLFSHSGEVVGLVGISRDLNVPALPDTDLHGLAGQEACQGNVPRDAAAQGRRHRGGFVFFRLADLEPRIRLPEIDLLASQGAFDRAFPGLAVATGSRLLRGQLVIVAPGGTGRSFVEDDLLREPGLGRAAAATTTTATAPAEATLFPVDQDLAALGELDL